MYLLQFKHIFVRSFWNKRNKETDAQENLQSKITVYLRQITDMQKGRKSNDI